MVRADGYVKVLDFGLAKRAPAAAVVDSESTATLDISVPGQIVGTVRYMSPEQIGGQDVDQRTDLFALGIILFEMLTGRYPWPQSSAIDTMHAILHDEAPSLDAVQAGTAHILHRLLSKSAAERYASAEAVLEALADPRGPVAGPPAAGSVTSIAVLPFAFLSEIEERQALSLGFADALITLLANLADLGVAPTSAILKYAPGSELAQVCRELGVRHALQGHVQKMGAQWRVSIQLFDSAMHRITLSRKHDFRMENVFEAQDEIGRRVVEALHSRFARVVQKSFCRRYDQAIPQAILRPQSNPVPCDVNKLRRYW
jgi:TolB-like protein